MEYQKAFNYTHKVITSRDPLHADTAGDIWHDTWLYYFNRTGKNLLDAHPGFIAKAIKWRLGYEYRKAVRTLNGVDYKLTFYGFDTVNAISVDDPYVKYLTKEFYKNLHDAIANYKSRCTGLGAVKPIKVEILHAVVDYLDQGYTTGEIGEMLDMSQRTIGYYKTKLKTIIEKMEYFQSPFNSNPLKIKMKVKRSTYDANPEKYADFEYNIDRNSDANEFYTQLSHKTENYGILIVEGKSLDL